MQLKHPNLCATITHVLSLVTCARADCMFLSVAESRELVASSRSIKLGDLKMI